MSGRNLIGQHEQEEWLQNPLLPLVLFFCAKTQTSNQNNRFTSNTCSSTKHDNLCKWLFVTEGGGGVGRYQGVLVFVRKSCLTICCLSQQRTSSWNWSSTILLLKTVWAEGEQGHSQGLATVSDGLWRGAYVSRHSCYATYSESQAHLCGCRTSP